MREIRVCRGCMGALDNGEYVIYDRHYRCAVPKLPARRTFQQPTGWYVFDGSGDHHLGNRRFRYWSPWDWFLRARDWCRVGRHF